MLNKPLSHIRPLLRLPSHPAPSPEHFTPNPSLLHHLPPNGVGNAVVSQAQSSAQAAGNSAGGAGRAGYGGGSAGAGNGGYTGHARAFLSLPQTSGTDPTSSLTTDENTRSESSTSARRSALLLKHRLAKHTRIVGPAPESVGRGVRREIEARAGGSRLSLLEVEDVEGREYSDRLLEGRPTSPSRIRRRSSIAFPTRSALPSSPHRTNISPLPSSRSVRSSRSSASRISPSHSRSSTPTDIAGRPDTLVRSRTGLEVWQVGIPRSRSQLSVRALSTQPDRTALLERDVAGTLLSSSTSMPPSRPPRQSGHVSMDLAGVDVPVLGRRVGQVRRNSTAAIQQTDETDEVTSEQYRDPSSEEGRASEQSTQPSPNEDDRRDRQIFQAIVQARKMNDRAAAHALVRHYRSSRTPSPFAESQTAGNQTLSRTLPLPSSYSHNTYNACLDALIHTRKPGQSIALILEVYNEMLERDLVPNTKTYEHVIVALCAREKDVWTAVKQWEEEKRWGKWTSQQLGTKWDEERAAEKDLVMQGYKAESNFQSAVKLFSAASFIASDKRILRFVYHALVDVAALQPEPNIEIVMQIFRQAQVTRSYGRRRLYPSLFRALGNAKNVEGLKEVWADYEDSEKKGESGEVLEWLQAVSDSAPELRHTPEQLCMSFKRQTWLGAIHAFAQIGEIDLAVELFEKILATPMPTSSSDKPDMMMPPYITQRVASEFLVVLGQTGYTDMALEWYPRIIKIIQDLRDGDLTLGSYRTYQLSDDLVAAGKWREAADIVQYWMDARRASKDTNSVIELGRLQHLYAAILAEALRADERGAEPVEIDEILSVLQKILPRQDPSNVDKKLPEIQMTLPASLIDAHCNLLIKLGRYQDIIPLMELFGSDQERYMTVRGALFSRIASSDIPLVDLCAIVKAYNGERTKWTFSSSEALVSRYANDRKSVNSPSDLGLKLNDWIHIMSGMTWLQPDKLSRGGYDEHLVLFMNDLRDLSTADDVNIWKEAKPHQHAALANVLVDRLGSERTKEMLTAVYGEDKARGLIGDHVFEEPSDASTDKQSPFITLPPTPESLPTSLESGEPLDTNPPPKLVLDSSFNQVIMSINRPYSGQTPQSGFQGVLEASKRGVTAFPSTLARLMINLGREGEEQKVRQLYELAHQALATAIKPEHQRTAWHTIEDGMLAACCHLGQLEQAGLHRARLVEAGMAPSADGYATMISCSKDTTDDALVARELFDESRAMNITPNLFLYNTIISKLSKARKAELALELFKHMRAMGIMPSSITYGAVINACCRVGDAESAETLFNEMVSQRNFKAKAPPFNTMMQFHLTTQPSRERVLHYYSALRGANVTPTAHTYKLLIDTYAVLPPTDLRAMERVFKELCADRRVEVQSTHWASLITAYGIYGNNVAKAIQTFESIPTHASTRDPRIGSDPVIWEAILNVVSNKGSLEEMMGFRQRMFDTGAKATAYVNNVLIAGFARAGHIDQAREVFESMGDSVTGVAAPNNHPTLLTSSGHVKPSTVTSTPTYIVYREPSTYEAMIRAELQAGTREAAEAICQRMEERRYPVAVYMRARAILDDPASVNTYQYSNVFVPRPQNAGSDVHGSAS